MYFEVQYQRGNQWELKIFKVGNDKCYRVNWEIQMKWFLEGNVFIFRRRFNKEVRDIRIYLKVQEGIMMKVRI